MPSEKHSAVVTSGFSLQVKSVGSDVRIPSAALHKLVAAMLEKTGVPEADAGIVAKGLVSADARGMNSHGILRLPVYIQRLLAGGFAPVANIEVVRETASTALLDGGNGLGAVITTRAMDLAISKARETGVAAERHLLAGLRGDANRQ